MARCVCRFLGGLGAVALLFGNMAQAQQLADCAGSPQQAAAAYDYVLGTQAIGGETRFGSVNPLLYQAGEIRGLGSNLLKISLAKGAAAKYGTKDAADRSHSVLQYIAGSPVLQQALDSDFTYYQLWVHSFTDGQWRDGVSDAEARAYYAEMYNLTAWLLKRYSGTGKVFLLGNWEGDWMLNGQRDRDKIPSSRAIKGMIAWLNIRQLAIDNAKAAIPHENVEVYHYVEVNLVKPALAGKPSVASSVLPQTNVDLVSYSSYEAIKAAQRPDIAAIRQPLTQAVQYLEGQLQPKPGLPFAHRVFIGEFGYHADKDKPLTVKQQFMKSRYVMQVALELDLPFALIWQLNNNEFSPNGTSAEMSLIDESGRKRALYFLLRTYLDSMREFVTDSCRQNGAPPAREVFNAQALKVLSTLAYEKMQQLADRQ